MTDSVQIIDNIPPENNPGFSIQFKNAPLSEGKKEIIADTSLVGYNIDIMVYERYITTQGDKLDFNSVITHLRPYFDQLKENNRLSTIQRKKTAIKKGISEKLKSLGMYKELLLLDKAMSEIRTGTIDSSFDKMKMLTYKEISQLVSKTSPRISCMIAFIYASACRVSEMINIKLKDIEGENGTKRIRIIGKRNKEGNLYIPSELYDKIIKVYNPIKYLFETKIGNKQSRFSIHTYVKQAGKRILGKNNLHPHIFRHIRLSHLQANGFDIAEVSAFARHKSVNTTSAIYCHNQLDVERVKLMDAMNKVKLV